MTGRGFPINILVVEDDAIDVEAVRRAFKRNGITNPMYHAYCGKDALELLNGLNDRPKIPQPCLMLLDINMPQMNGLEFLEKVRSDPALKENIAFMLTTSARDADIEKAYALNVAGYFLKEDLDKLISLFTLYEQLNRFPK